MIVVHRIIWRATQKSKEMKRRSSIHLVLLRLLLSMPIWYTMIVWKQMGFGEHGWESLDPSRSDIVIPRRVPDEMRSNEEQLLGRVGTDFHR